MAARRYWWAAAAAAGIYAAMWFGYRHHWPALDAVDDGMLGFFHDYGVHRPEWLAFWHDLSAISSTRVLVVVAVLAIGIALGYQRFRVAAFLAITVVTMGLVTAGAKALADRPRPATAMDLETSSSFPSGHALSITVFAFATVLWPGLSGRWRAVVTTLGAGLIVLVMLARVVLNVHHPSDVLAGSALGFLWYLAWVTFIPPWPAGHRPQRDAEAQSEAVSVPGSGR